MVLRVYLIPCQIVHTSFISFLTSQPLARNAKNIFSAVIFSLSALRADRRAGLVYLTDLAVNYPRIRRVVIADDDAEVRLISSLSPLPLDGVISKASSLDVLQEGLLSALNCAGRGSESTKNHWFINQNRMLSPTEREILRFMSNGY